MRVGGRARYAELAPMRQSVVVIIRSWFVHDCSPLGLAYLSAELAELAGAGLQSAPCMPAWAAGHVPGLSACLAWLVAQHLPRDAQIDPPSSSSLMSNVNFRAFQSSQFTHFTFCD